MISPSLFLTGLPPFAMLRRMMVDFDRMPPFAGFRSGLRELLERPALFFPFIPFFPMVVGSLFVEEGLVVVEVVEIQSSELIGRVKKNLESGGEIAEFQRKNNSERFPSFKTRDFHFSAFRKVEIFKDDSSILFLIDRLFALLTADPIPSHLSHPREDMFRNQYDTDVTVWSPQGRLHQVEYATEAVNQGTVCLGLRNHSYVVLAALKRSPNDLASHQRKISKIDDHLGIAMSGLTADGRSLVK